MAESELSCVFKGHFINIYWIKLQLIMQRERRGRSLKEACTKTEIWTVALCVTLALSRSRSFAKNLSSVTHWKTNNLCAFPQSPFSRKKAVFSVIILNDAVGIWKVFRLAKTKSVRSFLQCYFITKCLYAYLSICATYALHIYTTKSL